MQYFESTDVDALGVNGSLWRQLSGRDSDLATFTNYHDWRTGPEHRRRRRIDT